MTDEPRQDDVAPLRAPAAARDTCEDALAVVTHVDVLPRHTAAALQRLVDAHDERAGRRECRHDQPQQNSADRQA